MYFTTQLAMEITAYNTLIDMYSFALGICIEYPNRYLGVFR